VERIAYPWVVGVKVEGKKCKRYKDDLVRRKIQQLFSGNNVRKLVGYFSVTNKSVSARIPL
jgi:hypothetical protein